MTWQDQAVWQSSWLCHYLVLEQEDPWERAVGAWRGGFGRCEQLCLPGLPGPPLICITPAERNTGQAGRVIRDESPNIYQSKLALLVSRSAPQYAACSQMDERIMKGDRLIFCIDGAVFGIKYYS